MEKKIVDQKEYLKKYLSSGGSDDKKKKKKKKMKVGAATVKVIDDDIDLKNMRPLAENEFDMFIDVEDAPQIAGVVDERGPVDFTDKRRWKIIANDDDGDLTITTVDKENKQSKQAKNLNPMRKQKEYSDDDLSPPRVPKQQRNESHRKRKKDEDSDLSPPRLKSKKHNSKHRTPESDSDNNSSLEVDIPHHKSKKKAEWKEYITDDSDVCPPRRTKNYDSDLSPPRLKSKKRNSEYRTSESDSDSNSSLEVDIPHHKSKKKAEWEKYITDDSDACPPRRTKNYDSDLSPPRLKSKKRNSKYRTSESDSDNNSSLEIDIPHHKSKKKAEWKEYITDDSDLCPPRKTKNYDLDFSPPRKSKKHRSQKNKYKDKSDSDLSPPRRSKKDVDSDKSPLRKNRKDLDSDLSLPRPRKNKNYDSDESPPRRSKKHKHRRDSDSDLSPPRRKYKKNVNVYVNSKYKGKSDEFDPSSYRHNQNSYFDNRKSRYNDSGSLKQHKHRDEKIEKSRSHKYSEKSSRSDRKYLDSEMSPPRKGNRDMNTNLSKYDGDDRDFHKYKTNKFANRYDHDSKYQSHGEGSKSKHRKNNEEDNEKRMKKTLDGKKAGLQDARALREETEAYRKREAEHFSKLSKEVTGVGQATVVRDTKTGRKRNLEQEAAEDREKQKRQAEIDEKYAKWGRGLKQVEDHEERLRDDLYEMSKPLARYADDVDLDKRLREQEREGDPMLEYIKQKQIKEGKRKPDQPAYEGSYMPNRFGVKPGHRWDGVDRSNGYEKRWFEAQNVKIARQEEAYKWSTSDM
ncbi:BUD13 homolog [Anthophora quadrimaculata]